ncbi:tRNA (cytosine-5-)-methyltransferase ncl1 [Mitosporidium daphniae]|uniref:S-adenosyl-L-methionine-dependent methyltransferase n=1 Tax=Mitosporidium daphniae TaxID=1485682 RepID=A0A098VW82_9MICR|nr:S-adenosyl-L-methionine-dependent methyltransferase [Mitosporidium daphniae]KGG53139.1 S-adenosyl-L-methionine-dependent methyltransferase [Mitosporidium daphniae]|eukprot:XP_013239566.1 S-adenosyl-L-methionine-dependent methyltransferase [Mitosporidium daphniae]
MAFSKRRKRSGAQKKPFSTLSASRPRAEFRQIELKNDRFESYYRGSVIPEQEWEDFIGRMREPLPVTFRLPFSSMSGLLEKYLSKEFSFLERIEWYPAPGSAWKVAAGRTQVRRETHYAKLHSLLVRETEVGNICRQEAVSMIPPLFLKTLPSDSVLDMCAAPGSKTCQLVEMMRCGPDTGSFETPATCSEQLPLPTGVVVANDVDVDRASMMVHQVKRMNSPSLVVTTVDASQFPTSQKFDKILCDVPCSGDGTLRKNKLIWRTWSERDAQALQPLQIAILNRGLSLLRPGGKLVYSTCSMNPIENEDVIAAVLEKRHAEFSLVDCTQQLVDLKRRPGLSRGSPDLATERCMRFYPHLQDTGGFFVAVIESKHCDRADLVPQSKDGVVESKSKVEAVSAQKADPMPAYFAEAIDVALDQWGLRGVSKTPLTDLIIARKTPDGDSEDGQSQKLLPHLSLISAKARSFSEAWSARGAAHLVLYTGLAAFARQDGNDSYRIKYSALPYLIPFMDTSRIISISDPSDILSLLTDNASANKNSAAPVQVDGAPQDASDQVDGAPQDASDQLNSTDTNLSIEFEQDKLPVQDTPLVPTKEKAKSQLVRIEELSPSLREALEPLPIGCHIAQIANRSSFIVVPLWRGRFSAHLLVSKLDKASLNFLCSIPADV